MYPRPAWAGSSVGTSDRLKSDRSAVRPRPCPQAQKGPDHVPIGALLRARPRVRPTVPARMGRCSPASRSSAGCARSTSSRPAPCRSTRRPGGRRSPLPAVAPYVAATAAALDGPVALHLGRAPPRGVARRRVGVPRRAPASGRSLRSRRFHRAEDPTGLGVTPDRHPRDGLEPRGGRVGRAGPARPAGVVRHPRRGRRWPACGSSSPTAAAPPAGSASWGCATSASSPTRTGRPLRDEGRRSG